LRAASFGDSDEPRDVVVFAPSHSEYSFVKMKTPPG
jgi:DNA primase catalytic subunit